MATKISELSTNATPDSSSFIPIVETTTTEKTTLINAIRYAKRHWSGWFNVSNTSSSVTGIGTTATQIPIDGASSEVTYLPEYFENGLSDVFETGSDAKILFENFTVGSFGVMRANGVLTTSLANTSAKLIWKFYNSSDTEIFSFIEPLGYYKNTVADEPWLSEIPYYTLSTLVGGGYVELYIEFDNGTGNAVTASGVQVQINLW